MTLLALLTFSDEILGMKPKFMDDCSRARGVDASYSSCPKHLLHCFIFTHNRLDPGLTTAELLAFVTQGLVCS